MVRLHVATCADEATRESVDAKCRKLTAPWVRERAATVPDIELCGFYETHENAGDDALLPPGVYTLQDLRQFGRKKGFCPYFLARRMIVHANVIVYNYQYMLDPKVSLMVRVRPLPIFASAFRLCIAQPVTFHVKEIR
jgi:DNA excision repair protein ERCC-2